MIKLEAGKTNGSDVRWAQSAFEVGQGFDNVLWNIHYEVIFDPSDTCRRAILPIFPNAEVEDKFFWSLRMLKQKTEGGRSVYYTVLGVGDEYVKRQVNQTRLES